MGIQLLSHCCDKIPKATKGRRPDFGSQLWGAVTSSREMMVFSTGRDTSTATVRRQKERREEREGGKKVFSLVSFLSDPPL